MLYYEKLIKIFIEKLIKVRGGFFERTKLRNSNHR